MKDSTIVLTITVGGILSGLRYKALLCRGNALENLTCFEPVGAKLYRLCQHAKLLVELQDRLGVTELAHVVDRLLLLVCRGVLGLYHAMLSLVAASFLLENGCKCVDVERAIGGLVADVVGDCWFGHAVIEVETGFMPARNVLEPIDYLVARLGAKIARYSRLGEWFGLGIPVGYAAPIPPQLLRAPGKRSEEELIALKRLLDKYYRKPPIPVEWVKTAHLDAVLVLDTQRPKAIVLKPKDYYRVIGKLQESLAQTSIDRAVEAYEELYRWKD